MCLRFGVQRKHTRNVENSARESQDWRLWAGFKALQRDGVDWIPDSWFSSLLWNITEPRGHAQTRVLCVFPSWDSPQKANLGSRLKSQVTEVEGNEDALDNLVQLPLQQRLAFGGYRSIS